ncbi:MAG: oxidoreductase [Eggerthellaceae bacterium]|nr:oxidoreductase [Eggerthellaceae bacterium]
MSQMGLFINYDMCFGCHACEMACSQEKKLPAGEFGIHIAQYGPHKNIKGEWEYTYLPIPTKLCNLCPERTSMGKLPSCVHHCEAACIEYGSYEELSKLLQDHPRSVLFSV